MSTTLIIILIIAVWLFVLAPLVFRGNKPIRNSGGGFDDTRVVFAGGEDIVEPARRPRFPSKAHTTSYVSESSDYEVVEAEDFEIVDEPWPKRNASQAESDSAAVSNEDAEAEIIDGAVVEDDVDAVDVHEGEVVADTSDEIDAEDDNEAADEDSATVAAYAHDDSFTSPVDLLYPGAVDESAETEPAPAAEEQDNAQDASDEIDDSEDLSEEELEFAAARAARGGWDPRAENTIRATRYQRRQRTLIALGALSALALVLGFVAGGWLWTPLVVSVGLTVCYLLALRSQVQQERQLRALRIRHLRRARMGVLSRSDEHSADSHQLPLRRPGAIVVDMDDESPDFDNLDSVDISDEGDYGNHERDRREPPRPSRRLSPVSADGRVLHGDSVGSSSRRVV